jgi:hypothetical protein
MGCNSVDLLYLGLRGGSRAKRVVEKIEECVGRYVVACSFRCVTENFE